MARCSRSEARPARFLREGGDAASWLGLGVASTCRRLVAPAHSLSLAGGPARVRLGHAVGPRSHPTRPSEVWQQGHWLLRQVCGSSHGAWLRRARAGARYSAGLPARRSSQVGGGSGQDGGQRQAAGRCGGQARLDRARWRLASGLARQGGPYQHRLASGQGSDDHRQNDAAVRLSSFVQRVGRTWRLRSCHHGPSRSAVPRSGHPSHSWRRSAHLEV